MRATSERILITGANDGIGREMAYEFARAGAALGLLARRQPLLEEVRAECLRLGAARVEIASLDVTDFPRQKSVLEEMDRALGGATIFVANAGVTGRTKIREWNWEGLKQTLDVNLYAVIHGLETMKALMVARGGGTLSAVASVAGYRGLPDSGTYSCSKAAVLTYLESLSCDLSVAGIRVVSIVPGFIATELTRKNKGTMPFLMPVEKAGPIFARGVLRRQRVVIAPWQHRFFIVLLKALPTRLYEFVIAKLFHTVRGGKPRF